MKKLRLFLIVSVITSLQFIFISCSTVPITGRSQLNLIPDSELLAMSFQQYNDFLASNQVVNNTQNANMVTDVGIRIQHAVEDYFAMNNLTEELEGYRWEFNLVEDPQVNAWCMPGGKVVIYTGILPITQSETGLAVVMGHEIAHAIAEHGNERMSQALLQQLGGVALSVALSDEPATTRNLWMAAYGVGTTVGIMLPFGRSQESEADRLGLIFMSMAGYDPHEAIDFWQRMGQHAGSGPPEFLSTHPSYDTRISNIRDEYLPEALEYYNESKTSNERM